MRLECQYCHRGHEVPGESGVSHGICPKCLLCVQFESEAAKKHTSVSEYLDDNPALFEELIHYIKEELTQNFIWEGEYAVEVDSDIERLYNTYERRARLEFKSEHTKPDRR